MKIKDLYVYNKIANINDIVNSMEPEYEEALAQPVNYGLGAAGLGALGVGTALGLSHMLRNKGKLGLGLAALGGIAAPGLAGLGYEYSTRDDRAKEAINDDLNDMLSDIAMANATHNAPDEFIDQLNQKGQEIADYLNS